MIKECSDRMNGLYKVQTELNTKQKKTLVEGSILSRIHYAIEVVSSGSESNVKKLEGMKSREARYVLGISRKDWSRTAGYQELNWLTVPQTAIEFSLRLFFRILRTEKPERIFKSLHDGGSLLRFTDLQLQRMTKLAKKSWKTRVLRYAEIIPESLFSLDPKSPFFKSALKDWVKRNIPKDGDYVFKGKEKPQEDDWLKLELYTWVENQKQDFESLQEGLELWENEGEG